MGRIQAKIALIATLSIFSTVSFGQAADDWTSGEEIFQKVCQYCHTTGVAVTITGRQLIPAYIKYMVRNGMRAMPPFRQSELSEKDLDKIASYIAESK